MTHSILINPQVLTALNGKANLSKWNPVNFHDIEVSKFLAYFYREMKAAIMEEMDEGLVSDILEKHSTFFKSLDAHVYTLNRTDYTAFHSQNNHEFLEAIEYLKNDYLRALSQKISNEMIVWSIAQRRLSHNMRKLDVCNELQSNCFLSQF